MKDYLLTHNNTVYFIKAGRVNLVGILTPLSDMTTLSYKASHISQVAISTGPTAKDADGWALYQ